MKKINICFDLYCDETPLFIESIKQLSDEYNMLGVTLGSRFKKEVNTLPVTIEICNINDYITNDINNIDISIDNLKNIERKYDIDSLSFIILSDRYLSEYNYNDSLKILVGYILFYENLFSKYKINYYIDTAVALMPQFIAFKLAKKFNIIFLGIFNTPFSDARIVFLNDWQDKWDNVFNQYENNNFDISEIDSAKKYVKSFNINNMKPSYMNGPMQSNTLKIIFLKEFIKRFKEYFIYKKFNDLYDYMSLNPLIYAKREIKKIIMKKYFLISNKSIFDKVNDNDSFYLFPLHLQPEASTLMMAPYYNNQVTTIEYIAKSIPAGSYLYVKEHKSAFGKHSKMFYKNIRKLPNVKLISPFEDTRRLILKSICPIVLTSTVGWEAILLGKPTIALGHVFYNRYGLTVPIDSYEHLSNTLQYKIENYSVDKKTLYRFIASIFAASHTSIFDVPHFQPKRVLSHENILDFSNAIKNEIKMRSNDI